MTQVRPADDPAEEQRTAQAADGQDGSPDATPVSRTRRLSFRVKDAAQVVAAMVPQKPVPPPPVPGKSILLNGRERSDGAPYGDPLDVSRHSYESTASGDQPRPGPPRPGPPQPGRFKDAATKVAEISALDISQHSRHSISALDISRHSRHSALDVSQHSIESHINDRPLKRHVRFEMTNVTKQRNRDMRICGGICGGNADRDRVFNPTGRFIYAWDMLRLVLWCFTVFWWPFRTAFESKPRMGSWWHLGDVIPDVYFALDIGVTFVTAFQVGAELEKDFTRIAQRYMRFHGLFDVGAKGPSLWIALIAMVPIHLAELTENAIAVKLLSCTRLLRVEALTAWFRAKEKDVHFAVEKIAIFKFILALFGAAHWVGCVWWFVASWSRFDETTWVSQYLLMYPEVHEDDRYGFNGTYCMTPTGFDNDPEVCPVYFQYHVSLYWGFQAMTNLGYPGIGERVFARIRFCAPSSAEFSREISLARAPRFAPRSPWELRRDRDLHRRLHGAGLLLRVHPRHALPLRGAQG